MKKTVSFFVILLALSLVFSSCSEKETPVDEKEYAVTSVDFSNYTETDDNNRVFYEIFVGSFSDSNGDGIGDLRGIINRFDYLNDGDAKSGRSLGVEGIWLTPIFKSPSYHKYDVTDYYTVDPDFGTEEDLIELVNLCHERDVKLIIDLPINHTGIMNEWYSKFVTAHRQGNTDDEFYNFYSFYTKGETPPAGRSFGQVSGTDDYYECNFSGSMPELDFDNEAVRNETLNIAKHYLSLGVDGFRFDAAKYIYFGDNAKSAEFWAWYIGELKKIDPSVYTVAEVWDSDGITDIYYPAFNCFNFTMSQVSGVIAEAAKAGDVNVLTSYTEKYINKVTSLRSDAAIVPFITNHDMDRAAGFLTVAGGQMRTGAALLILSPGSPFIYYGEEIGMRGSRGGAATDANRRLAMLWGDGDTVADPEGTTYSASSQTDDTVELQKERPDSLLTFYKELIMIRKANPEIARGTYRALTFKGTKLGGFTSEYNGKTVCVIHNTSGSSVTVDLSDVTNIGFEKLAAVIGEENATLSGTTLTVGGRTSVVLR